MDILEKLDSYLLEDVGNVKVGDIWVTLDEIDVTFFVITQADGPRKIMVQRLGEKLTGTEEKRYQNPDPSKKVGKEEKAKVKSNGYLLIGGLTYKKWSGKPILFQYR